MPKRTEGASFLDAVPNDLKTRGVRAILIACVDGLSGFPEAEADRCDLPEDAVLARPLVERDLLHG
jgi:hypothetical protein